VEVCIVGAAMKYHVLKQSFVSVTKMLSTFTKKQVLSQNIYTENQPSADYRERWEKESNFNSKSKLGFLSH
jgi:transposase-like protein